MMTETRVKPSDLLYMQAVLFGMLAAPIQAQESSNIHPLLTNKYTVDVGAFLPDRTFKVRVNGTATATNSTIDFEDSMRFDEDDETFELNLRWRFGEK